MVSGCRVATHKLRHHAIKCIIYGLKFTEQRVLLQGHISELLNIILIGLFDLAGLLLYLLDFGHRSYEKLLVGAQILHRLRKLMLIGTDLLLPLLCDVCEGFGSESCIVLVFYLLCGIDSLATELTTSCTWLSSSGRGLVLLLCASSWRGLTAFTISLRFRRRGWIRQVRGVCGISGWHQERAR